MRRVLAAIDGGPCSPAVLACARSIADLFEATAVGLHVSEDRSGPAARFAAEAGVAIETVTGSPLEAITAAAGSPAVVAVVLGARGEHHRPRPAGHLALAAITRVNKPVVVVPPRGGPGPRIGRILLPLEGSHESSKAVADALTRAHRREIEIVVLHVHAPEAVPPFQDQAHHQTSAWQREFTARFVTASEARVQVIQRVGDTAEIIPAVAREIGADLIVLGWNQSLEPGHGRVVRYTLADSPSPVLLFPTAG